MSSFPKVELKLVDDVDVKGDSNLPIPNQSSPHHLTRQPSLTSTPTNGYTFRNNQLASSKTSVGFVPPPEMLIRDIKEDAIMAVSSTLGKDEEDQNEITIKQDIQLLKLKKLAWLLKQRTHSSCHSRLYPLFRMWKRKVVLLLKSESYAQNAQQLKNRLLLLLSKPEDFMQFSNDAQSERTELLKHIISDEELFGGIAILSGVNCSDYTECRCQDFLHVPNKKKKKKKAEDIIDTSNGDGGECFRLNKTENEQPLNNGTTCVAELASKEEEEENKESVNNRSDESKVLENGDNKEKHYTKYDVQMARLSLKRRRIEIENEQMNTRMKMEECEKKRMFELKKRRMATHENEERQRYINIENISEVLSELAAFLADKKNYSPTST